MQRQERLHASSPYRTWEIVRKPSVERSEHGNKSLTFLAELHRTLVEIKDWVHRYTLSCSNEMEHYRDYNVLSLLHTHTQTRQNITRASTQTTRRAYLWYSHTRCVGSIVSEGRTGHFSLENSNLRFLRGSDSKQRAKKKEDRK